MDHSARYTYQELHKYSNDLFVPIVILTHRLIPIDLVAFKLVFDRRNIEVSYRPSLGIEDTIQG